MAASVGWTGSFGLGLVGGMGYDIHSTRSVPWTTQQTMPQGVRGCLRMVDECGIWSSCVAVYATGQLWDGFKRKTKHTQKLLW